MKGDYSGYAYPRVGYQVPGGDWQYGQEGITVRQYYAAKAMQGLIASGYLEGGSNSDNNLSKRAFQIADAMLAKQSD